GQGPYRSARTFIIVAGRALRLTPHSPITPRQDAWLSDNSHRAHGKSRPLSSLFSPLLRVKRTCLFALHMSAFDPKRTLAVPKPGPSRALVRVATIACLVLTESGHKSPSPFQYTHLCGYPAPGKGRPRCRSCYPAVI